MQLMGMVRHGTCVGARRRLDDLCDGELGVSAEARVRRHLAGCSRCRRALARLKATIVDVAQLQAGSPPELAGLRERVRRRIVEESADAPGQDRRGTR
ncbi:MAG: zf-HC2 domain-containing protein [Acidimicrobiales bacterium]